MSETTAIPRTCAIAVTPATCSLTAAGLLVYADLHDLVITVTGITLNPLHTYRLTLKRVNTVGTPLAVLSTWVMDAAAGTLTGELNLNIPALGTLIGVLPSLTVQADFEDVTENVTLGISRKIKITNPVHRNTDTPPASAVNHTYTDAEIDGLLARAFTMTAGAAPLSALRAVRADAAGLAVYCDAAAAADADSAIGITQTAAAAGAAVTVVAAGRLTDANWAWTPGAPVYLGPSGTLTQTAPASAFVQQIGVADSAISLIVNIQMAIKTAA